MRDKEAEEEEMYSILNELDIEKVVLENTLSQPKEELDKYPEYLLEQYEEELEMFKRTIAYIEKLNYKINLNELDRDYVNRNFIAKDKIREIIKEELPDDDICKSCGRYDVNGVVIKQKLIKVLEEE